jgi:hypothetical protein
MSSRFNNTDYDASGGANNDDYDNRDGLLVGKYGIVTAVVADVGVNDQFGTSVVFNLDDVEVVEGVVTDREGAAKKKVYGWSNWFDRDPETGDLVPFEEGEEISIDVLGRRVTESAGGDKYRYTVEEGVMEGRDDPVSLGDRDYWVSNSKKTRTLCKVLSAHGHDIINEENKREDGKWLNAETGDDFNLRDDIQGRRIMFWYQDDSFTVEEDGEEEVVEFTDAVVLDEETEVGITIRNGDADQEDLAESESQTETSDTEEEQEEPETEDFPEDIEDAIRMFARTNQTDKDKLAPLLEDEAPDDYDLDLDAVVAEIKRRSN